MKFEMKTVVIREVKKIQCNMGVRYWEDATVNGKRDVDGDLIPLKRGDTWDITIDIDSGKIDNWPSETTAHVHYKVCDAGTYKLIDTFGDVVVEKDGYVPNFLCPSKDGYGDYVIMKIDGDGRIQNWDSVINTIEDYFNEDD